MHFLSTLGRKFLYLSCITALSALSLVAFQNHAEADKFCCGGTPEECCATKGKVICPDEGNVCRTRCLGLEYHKCENAEDNWLCPVDHECGEVIGECAGISMVCEACEKHILAANMSWASAFACKADEYCNAHGCQECPKNATCDGRDFTCAPWSSLHPYWNECVYYTCGFNYELRFLGDGTSICVCIDEYVCGEKCCYNQQYCSEGECLNCPKNAICDVLGYMCIEGHSINADETACCPDGMEHTDEGGRSQCCEEGYDFIHVTGKANLYTCCLKGQRAYWDGTAAVCCSGIPSSVVGTSGKYVCCAGQEDEKWQAFNTGGGNHSCCEVSDNKRVVRVAGSTSYTCCDSTVQMGYGDNLCCDGEVYLKNDGSQYGCCAKPNTQHFYEATEKYWGDSVNGEWVFDWFDGSKGDHCCPTGSSWGLIYSISGVEQKFGCIGDAYCRATTGREESKWLGGRSVWTEGGGAGSTNNESYRCTYSCGKDENGDNVESHLIHAGICDVLDNWIVGCETPLLYPGCECDCSMRDQPGS